MRIWFFVFGFFLVLEHGRDCTHIRGKHGASFEKDFWCKPSSEIMLWEKQEEEKKNLPTPIKLTKRPQCSTLS